MLILRTLTLKYFNYIPGYFFEVLDVKDYKDAGMGEFHYYFHEAELMISWYCSTSLQQDSAGPLATLSMEIRNKMAECPAVAIGFITMEMSAPANASDDPLVHAVLNMSQLKLNEKSTLYLQATVSQP